ncbi:hypothetical protein EF888_17055 [Silicimonas algicola]|uniref:Regulator of nucleoside diphosphate kinase n=1 Tax=Silicimonas algicola TaxID=1826607 RepID=A0A316G8D6_9RHOB|nr:hypothetical protein [Silicimonas algicola]AZQ68686.1 hypothetical protein EF888_17055 [Silicimonas algicola]PWK56246.1 hypothetical protein C8D95_105314 [Silicimonas algicola]
MTVTRITHLPSGSDFRSLFEPSAIETGFYLTVDDRVGIERLLRHLKTRNAPNPPLLNGLLHHKLRISRGAREPAPPEMVVAGRQVTYMISGEGSRSGVLTMRPVPLPGHVLVASLLGATLIGMRKLQKVPLLRDDGSIDVLVVLDVSPPSDQDAG